MLKENVQITMDMSPYQGLYDAIKLKENIDFSFVNPMLKKTVLRKFDNQFRINRKSR